MAPKLSSKQWALSHLITVLLLILVLFQFFGIQGKKISVSFLDVGQGDAVLIQTEEFKNILIDAGPDGKVVEELSKKLGFFNQKIDLFILTHPDLDHVGGILDIMQKYPIERVMLTGVVSSNQIYNGFLQKLKDGHISIIYPQNNRDLQIGKNTYLDILYPFTGSSLIGKEAKNVNDTSIAFVLRDLNGASQMLLTGDAEEGEERELLLSGQAFTAPIFKLGHHGSKTANTENFLSATRPETIIISAGKDNKFGHPHEETLSRLPTDDQRFTWDGAVDFVVE